MKRKIVCICIISMFLLIGLTSISTAEIKLGSDSGVDFGKIIGYDKVPRFWIFSRPDFYIEEQEFATTLAPGNDITIKMSAELEDFDGILETAIVLDVEINVFKNGNEIEIRDNHDSLMTSENKTIYELDFVLPNSKLNTRNGDSIDIEINIKGQLYYPILRLTNEWESDRSSATYRINIIKI